MRILGVDPGSAVCGFGVVDRGGRYVTAGTIQCASLAPGPMRLRRIHEGLLAIIDEFSPAALSLERHFVAANVQSAFRLGEARAMAMLAAASAACRCSNIRRTKLSCASPATDTPTRRK